MTNKIYFFEQTIEFEKAIERIENIIPCFVFIEPVEMNWVKVEIKCRIEDVKTIEKYLGKSVYSHAFRHLCCTYLLEIGIPKEVVQQIFRWKTDQVPTYDDRDKDKELANFMIEFNRKSLI